MTGGLLMIGLFAAFVAAWGLLPVGARVKARPPVPYDAWLAEQEHGLDRLRACGLDPADDALEQRAADEAEADRAYDHTPITR